MTDFPETTERLFIVGIGASAGGLEAIRALLHSAPEDVAATYVVAQHMSPSHRSMLTVLIDRETHLSVAELDSPTRPERNTVYVTPPNTDVVYDNGALVLVEAPASRIQPKPSVDRLLRSIAAEAGDHAIGIILSGTGSDGSLGIRSIREAGGITFAQDDKTSKYDGMPNSAIETGCIDLILPPVEIAARLSKLSGTRAKLMQATEKEKDQLPLTNIMAMLLARTEVDFRDYKPTTVARRLERRMVALGVASQEAYADHCREHPEELDRLFQDLLISVTKFFRDQAQFEALKSHIASLVESNGEDPLRVWVAGCATGEEAYSVAMLFCEVLGGTDKALASGVKIFASDIDAQAISTARVGRYEAGALNDFIEDLSGTYFSQQGDHIFADPALKRLVLFSVHNVVQDPPFIKLDLICCRNLLIYFGQVLQDKALENFHYGLNSGGLLFLGTAESASASGDLFGPTPGQGNILRRRKTAFSDYQSRARQRAYTKSVLRAAPAGQTEPASDRSLAADQVNPLVRSIVSAMGGTGVLMTPELRMVSVFGDMTSFVSLKDGARLGFDHTLLIEPLANEMRVLATVAKKKGEPQIGFAHEIGDAENGPVRLSVFPLAHPRLTEDLMLVLFQQAADNGTAEPAFAEAPAAFEGITELERELTTTKEALQHAISEWETANEELESLNEELQSNNEELQSMNEELETANQELQSTNEELITNNETLHITSTELKHVTDELAAILQQLETPLLIVSKAMMLTRISDSAMTLFDVKPGFANLHVSQLALPKNFPALALICDEVLRTGTPDRREIESGDHRYRMTTAPYSTSLGDVTGVTVIINDQTAAVSPAA